MKTHISKYFIKSNYGCSFETNLELRPLIIHGISEIMCHHETVALHLSKKLIDTEKFYYLSQCSCPVCSLEISAE